MQTNKTQQKEKEDIKEQGKSARKKEIEKQNKTKKGLAIFFTIAISTDINVPYSVVTT